MKRLLVILSAVALIGCAGAKQKAVEDAMYALWNEGDMSVIEKAYAPELQNGVREFVNEYRTIYPDIQVRIDDFITTGPYYVTLWTVTGTHKDLGLPVELSGVSVRVREGGKFVREHMYYDMKDVYDQLGFQLVPPDGATPFGVIEASAPVQEAAPEEAAPVEDAEPAEDAAPTEEAATEDAAPAAEPEGSATE
jgi:hypothetical protein